MLKLSPGGEGTRSWEGWERPDHSSGALMVDDTLSYRKNTKTTSSLPSSLPSFLRSFLPSNKNTARRQWAENGPPTNAKPASALISELQL